MNRNQSYLNVNSYWYEEVPDHWNKTKNKYVFKQDKELVGNSWGDYVLLTMGKSGVKPRDMDGGGKFPESFETYQKVSPNQIVFCLFDIDETPRTVGLSKDNGMITSAYDVFSTNEGQDPQFWTFFYQMIDDHKGLRPYYTGLRKVVRSETFMGIEVFSPPFEEQRLISQYLEKKTKQIDCLIEKIEKKIDLLYEQKNVLINQFITKGINSNEEMKNSGVDWIGEIPFNWKRIKIKNIVSIKITDGPHETPKFEEFGVPFISAEGIVDNKINFNSKRGYINLETHKLYSKKCVPLRDDVLVVKSGSTTGKSAIVETDEIFNIWSPLCILRSNKDLILPKFLFYCVQSRFFLNQVETSWSYGTQPNIGMGVIENLTLLLPPKKEQQLIVDILNNKLRNSNLLIEQNETKKNLLYEYRQSLISSVVTGKIQITSDMI